MRTLVISSFVSYCQGVEKGWIGNKWVNDCTTSFSLVALDALISNQPFNPKLIGNTNKNITKLNYFGIYKLQICRNS